MNINLYFILEILKTTKDWQAVSNLDILFIQPGTKIILFESSLASRIVVVIEPEHTCYHTSGIVKPKEMFVILLDVEDDGSSDVYLGQKILISQNKEYLTCLLVLLTLHVMVH